jgi:hypothetical protein
VLSLKINAIFGAMRRLRGYAGPSADEHNLQTYRHFLRVVLPILNPFDFEQMQTRTLSYVDSMRTHAGKYQYRYALSTVEPNIYCSTYACMIRSLYGDLNNLTACERKAWISYFDAHQSPTDGLFRDPVLSGSAFEAEDWWGARHLAVQVIACYAGLGSKPRHDFRFLEFLFEPHAVDKWLGSRDWKDHFDFVGNEIMNYGCLLQFSRDIHANRHAGNALSAMKKWLWDRACPESGMWVDNPFASPKRLSLAVQSAYHLYPLFFYDKEVPPYQEPAINCLLATQNELGGYGVGPASTACEDIDTIEPLYRFLGLTDYRAEEVRASLAQALPWVLSNMNEDGGFVFRRNSGFVYGHREMSSQPNESNLFATWFRTLSLAYLTRGLDLPNRYELIRCPGYTFV